MPTTDRRTDATQDNWMDVVISFQRALRCFSEFVEPVLKAEGCSNVSVENVCFLLTMVNGPRRFGDVLIEDRVRGSNMSYALKSLMKDGLVDTVRDPNDARKKIVTPTEPGRRVIQAVRAALKGKGPDVADAKRSVALFETHCASLPRSAKTGEPALT